MKLEPHRVGRERPARQPRPLDGVLAFLDPLLRGAALNVEANDALGRPITYGTTEAFLSHFGLEEVGDLPGLDELKGAGLLEGNLPAGFGVPIPSDDGTLRDDEEPLDPGDHDLGLAPPASRTEK